MNLRERYPDQKFDSHHHAFVSGVIAAELSDAESFGVEIDSGVPVVRVRFGERRYALIVVEEQ